MKRIYKVTTPAGVRLVEADTQSQAIKHCMTGGYSASPVNSSEMWDFIQNGAQVEKAVVTPKALKALPAALQAAPPPPPAVAPAPAPKAAKPVPPKPAAKAPILSGKPAPTQGWTPPEGVHPVIAEQQRINPTAAAVAGAPAPKAASRAPILATRASAKPATPPVAPSQGGDPAWQTRATLDDDDDEEAEDNCATVEE